MEATSANPGQDLPISPLDAATQFLGEDWVRLQAQIDGVIDKQSDILSADEQSFYRAGKRVRPLMAILCARALLPEDTPTPDQVIAAAASIEIAHIGSLIHDDIIDKAPLRRGLPTFNASRGYEFALLMGDLQIMESAKMFAGFLTSESDLDLMRDYLDTAHLLCRGQIEELLNDGQEWDLEQIARRYYRIIDRKTARLFSFSCEAGARLADAYPSQVRHARQFGIFTGRAFQIADDVLDVMQSTDDAGKEALTDLVLGRLSLPVIYMVHVSSRAPEVLAILQRGVPSEAEVQELWEELMTTRAHIRAYNEARVMVIEGKKHLDALPETPAREHLRAIADFIVDRKFHSPPAGATEHT